jgi:hypothetical protein
MGIDFRYWGVPCTRAAEVAFRVIARLIREQEGVFHSPGFTAISVIVTFEDLLLGLFISVFDKLSMFIQHDSVNLAACPHIWIGHRVKQKGYETPVRAALAKA